ncbi:microtubule nucleation factor SSNA1 isoform X1 [Lepidochelys kempii]|uniref:microtubule nucleation factor SSNA1 isoform X1 n=1 Tax=Caretta caretta TaxID=8467 RepID=UPI003C6FD919
MTQQGAALQSYNNELVKCIEELCTKRDELSHQIQQEEGEKNKLQNDIRLLTEKLARVNESLARKMATRNEFEKTIAETEAAYTKVFEFWEWKSPILEGCEEHRAGLHTSSFHSNVNEALGVSVTSTLLLS